MRLTQFTTNESRRATDAVMLTEAKILNEWSSVGKMLVEYKLSPEQIQQIFKAAEAGQTGMGGNRTMLGQGKDQVAAVNKAWEDLKSQMQNSAPVKGFDQKVNAALNKIGMGSADPEFENQVSGWVQKYRDFAKQHPIAQGAIYAVLIALTGLSGAGIAGAATLGLLKMADRVLQGDRFTSAMYKGAKTGAMAYAVGQLKDYFKTPDKVIPQGTPAKLPDGTEYVVQKGDTLSQIAQKNGVSVKDLMAANSGQTVPTGDQVTWNDANPFTDINPMGDAVPPGTGVEQGYDVRTNLTNPDVLKTGQKIHIPGSLGPTQTYADGVGTAADTWDKVKDGTYSASEISRNQAAKWGLEGAGKYNPPAGAGDVASSAADKAADAATNVATDAGTNAATNAATGADKASDVADTASNTASSVSSNTPTLSLSDTGNGIKGDLTLPDGRTVPTQAFPSDGIQPRMPFGSEKVTVDFNGQKVDAYIYNGKAYIRDFDTNTLNSPGPTSDASGLTPKGGLPDQQFAQADTDAPVTNQGRLKMNQWRQDVGSPNAQPTPQPDTSDSVPTDATAPAKVPNQGRLEFEKMKRNGWGKALAESSRIAKFTLTESELRAVFKLAHYNAIKRRAINEGIWDSIKGAAGKAVDWAQTKGHNLTTKITADKLNSAWQQAGKQPESKTVRDFLVAQGVEAKVADDAIKSVANVRGKSTQDRRAAAQGTQASFKQPKQAKAQQQAPATQQPQAQQPDELGRIEPTMDAPVSKPAPAQQSKTSQVPANWGGQQQQQQQAPTQQASTQQASTQQAPKANKPMRFADKMKARGFQSAGTGGRYNYVGNASMTEEVIADKLRSELDAFMGRETKVDKRDISKRPQDREVQKKVTEVSSDKLQRYMKGVSDDSQKHEKDPSKRKPEKASRSVSGFAKASNRLDKRNK